METVARLNELLAAERAGVETLSRLLPLAPDPAARRLFEGVRDDEAWSCVGLAHAIREQGAEPTAEKGDFAAKVMAEPTLAAKLALLNRGQAWVRKRLDGLIAAGLSAASTEFLTEMRARHLRNIEACDRLVKQLGG
jgi:hypothetical protein